MAGAVPDARVPHPANAAAHPTNQALAGAGTSSVGGPYGERAARGEPPHEEPRECARRPDRARAADAELLNRNYLRLLEKIRASRRLDPDEQRSIDATVDDIVAQLELDAGKAAFLEGDLETARKKLTRVCTLRPTRKLRAVRFLLGMALQVLRLGYRLRVRISGP